MERFKDIPDLAKWKALIIDYGIELAEKSIFNNLPNINDYKIKYRIKHPEVKGLKVTDNSGDIFFIPEEIIISKNGKKSLVKLNYRKNSPLVLSIEDGKIVLLEKGITKVSISIELVKKRKYQFHKMPKELNPLEPSLKDFVQVIGLDRIAIMEFEGCWHWNTGNACKFCDTNPKRPGIISGMPSVNTLSDYNLNVDDWWNSVKDNYYQGIEYTFKKILQEEIISPHQHFQLMSGNLPNTRKIWEISGEIAEVVNRVRPIKQFDSYLNIAAPREDQEQWLSKAKYDWGFNNMVFNLEVIGRDRFREVCPGKSALMGYENTINCMEMSVKIFGRGNVRSNFVLGAQPVDELLRGIEDLAEKGIVADYSIFSPKKGTPWEDRTSPDMETIVNFSQELAKIYKKYGYSGIYCSLSSRSNILHELMESEE
ncbi:MAG: radical SAM protein [bacterium]